MINIIGFSSGIGLIYCMYRYKMSFTLFNLDEFMVKMFLFCMNIYANIQLWLKNYFKKNETASNIIQTVFAEIERVCSYLFNYKVEFKTPIWYSNSDLCVVYETNGLEKKYKMEEQIVKLNDKSYMEFCEEDRDVIFNDFIKKYQMKQKIYNNHNTNMIESIFICKYFSSIYVFISNKEDRQINNKIAKPSKSWFITVQYTHETMSEKHISLDIPENMYMVNNELFSPSFVLRCLQYQRENYYFDMNYTLHLIDNHINMFTLKSNQYIQLEENTYNVKNLPY